MSFTCEVKRAVYSLDTVGEGGARSAGCHDSGRRASHTGMAGPSLASCWSFILREVQLVSPLPSSGASRFSFMCTWQGFDEESEPAQVQSRRAV